MNKIIFEGVSTALITPFKDGKTDYDSIGYLIDIQIASGISSVTVSGTTGESATLSDRERCELYEYSANRVSGRIPVIAGTGTNSTERACELSRSAVLSGCDALLAVTPYYNKSSPEGLYAHYMKLKESAPDVPIIAYNVPSRTGVSIPIEILSRLHKGGAISAIKEASGDLSRVAKIAAYIPSLVIYSGNDDQIIPIMSLGGKGVISVLSNIIPHCVCKMCSSYLVGDHKTALSLQLDTIHITELLFADVNPIPVKYVMSKLGLCREEYRLPLVSPDESLKRKLDSLLPELSDTYK